jgi:iron complex outermembrane receptor protein
MCGSLCALKRAFFRPSVLVALALTAAFSCQIVLGLFFTLASQLAFADDRSQPSELGRPVIPGDENSRPTEILIKGAPFTQPLEELPQSASVILPEVLEDRGSVAFQDVIDSTPGLSWSGGTSRPRFFLIRGVGELEQYEGAPNPSVATIIDDIDFSGLGLVTPLFDVEQIEVLRGPQGIRFGSSALGGAVSVKTEDPTPVTSGRVQLMVGNDDFRSGAAAIGGVVPGTDDRLQLRFSAFSAQSNGFRDNAFLGRDDTNQRDESLARLKVRYEANSWLTVDAAGWLVRNNNGFDAFAIDNSFTTQSDRPGRDDMGVNAGSVKFTMKLPAQISLISVSSLMKTRQGYAFDGDWGNNPFWAPDDPYDFFSDSDRTRETLSHEVRLALDDPEYLHGESYRWLTGVFAQRLTEDSVTTELSNGEPYDFLQAGYRANTIAGFGQVEVPFGMRTDLTTGLRVEHRDAGYSDSRSASFSPEYTMLGGSMTLSHEFREGIRFYMSGSRGFKGGGFNPGPSVPESRRQYDPEYLWNFEAGVKGSWWNHRLTTNFSVFHQLRRDQQLKLAIQDNPSDPLAFTYVTESSARGRSTGSEFEGAFRVAPGLELFTSGMVMTSEFTDVPGELAGLGGRDFSHASTWQFSTGAQWNFLERFFSRVEVTGRDSFFFDDSHNERSDPYTLLNASVGLRSNSWRITVWGRNLGNQDYAVRGFFFGNEPPDFPNKEYIQRGDPRAVGVTAVYDF